MTIEVKGGSDTEPPSCYFSILAVGGGGGGGCNSPAGGGSGLIEYTQMNIVGIDMLKVHLTVGRGAYDRILGQPSNFTIDDSQNTHHFSAKPGEHLFFEDKKSPIFLNYYRTLECQFAMINANWPTAVAGKADNQLCVSFSLQYWWANWH